MAVIPRIGRLDSHAEHAELARRAGGRRVGGQVGLVGLGQYPAPKSTLPWFFCASTFGVVTQPGSCAVKGGVNMKASSGYGTEAWAG